VVGEAKKATIEMNECSDCWSWMIRRGHRVPVPNGHCAMMSYMADNFMHELVEFSAGAHEYGLLEPDAH